MLSIARLHLAPMILTVIIVAGLAATSGSRQHREATAVVPSSARPVAATATAPRACATPWGLCPIRHVRVGDPCGCPHPLHGVVRGRTISLGGGVIPATGRLRGDDADEPLRLGPSRDD